MTIKAFLQGRGTKENPEIESDDILLEAIDIWSNAACKGYLISAAKKLDYHDEQIQKFLWALERSLDDISVDEAESIYRKSPY